MSDEIRALIMDAIRSDSKNGVDRDYIDQWVGNHATPYTVGQLLRRMVEDGLIERREDSNFAITANGQKVVVSAAPAKERIELAPFLRTRPGQRVTVEHSPAEFDNVVRVEVKIANRWMAVPMFAGMRICIGPDIPRWHNQQETFEDVQAVRLIFKDSNVFEPTIKSGVPVTFAPGT